jgi:hypothetical protein
MGFRAFFAELKDWTGDKPNYTYIDFKGGGS